LVHGLQSSPQVWFPLANEMSLTPEVGGHYQFYYFFYPTGFPMAYSASHLRSALEEASDWMRSEGRNDRDRELILIGHSMGGMLSRMQVIAPGRMFAEAILEDEAETLLAMPNDNVVRRALVFEPNSDVSRVIFMAVPHRGAPMASGFIGRLVRALVKLPTSLVEEVATLANPFQKSDLLLRLRATSIDSLSPNNRLTQKWDDLPILAPYHSIIGRHRSRRDGTFSDGVVPYKSSHLPGAESELIISSDHMVPLRPEAIAETKRILTLHRLQN
ncbi:MAG: alpha/beta fold hydrolase, partial [Verrucomicrobiia bacterium]